MGAKRIKNRASEGGSNGWDWWVGSIQDPWYAWLPARAARTRAKRAFIASCYNYAFWENLFEICFKGISNVSNGATKVAKVWHLKCSWIGWGHDIFVSCTQKKRNPKPNNYWTTACWLFRSSQYFFLSNPLLHMLGKLTKVYSTSIVRVKFLYNPAILHRYNTFLSRCSNTRHWQLKKYLDIFSNNIKGKCNQHAVSVVDKIN